MFNERSAAPSICRGAPNPAAPPPAPFHRSTCCNPPREFVRTTTARDTPCRARSTIQRAPNSCRRQFRIGTHERLELTVQMRGLNRAFLTVLAPKMRLGVPQALTGGYKPVEGSQRLAEGCLKRHAGDLVATKS
jgi:hypothetical protein